LIQLNAIRSRGATVARILLVVVPLVLAACKNAGGGSGY
jgi:predicted small secreted protein